MDRKTDPNETEFSVLLSVYAKDDPTHLDEALRSLIQQTRPPDQVVVVADGPLTVSLQETISTWRDRHADIIEVAQLAENQGLGKALNTGLERCANELVARMDADDISRPTRFETQIRFFDENPDVTAVGGYIAEFDHDPKDILHVREVPITPSDIEQFARSRNPMNHVTVMMKKSLIESVGGYKTRPGMEDYHLWVRLLQRGDTLANVPEILVDVRTGDEMYGRRGGVQYALDEYRLQKEFYDFGFTTALEFSTNLGMRIPVRLLPNRIRSFVYERFLRE